MNAVAISNPFAGRCVYTIVRTRPMRPAIRAATSAENADNSPAQKKIVPLTANESPNRFCNHTTSSAVITNPPPNESTLNSTASR